MSKEEKDYSEYLIHTRGLLTVYGLVCGFLFSTITLLVANFKTFDLLSIQVVLFVLIGVFDLFLYNILDQMVSGIYLVRKIPPLTKHLQSSNIRATLGFILFGVTPIFLFFLRESYYLVAASLVTWVVFTLVCYIRLIKPMMRFRATNEAPNIYKL
jgi:hypothetical protein